MYTEVVNRALLAKRSNEKYYEDKNNKRKGEATKEPKGSNTSHYKKQNSGDTNENYSSSQSRRNYP